MNKRELKDRVKRDSSWGALRTLLQELNNESLKVLKATKEDHRYAQARVNTLEEIIDLLPNIPE